MGVRGWLVRAAALRPRVLVIGCLYGTRVRLVVEAEARRRGWAVAASPAEAGVMAVCGTPGEEMGEAVQAVWEAMGEPRVLVELPSDMSDGGVVAALDDAVAALGEGGTPRGDHPVEQAEHMEHAQPAEHGHGAEHGAHAEHGGHGEDGGHSDHGGHGEHGDHGGHGQHGGHGGHEHHMGVPGGVAMADRGEDRDGLKLDRLHVPLGPVLADWPAGLVVEAVLQGDVIQKAVVRAVPPGETGAGFWEEPRRGEGERWRAAACLDSLGRLLAVAGWPAAARKARRLRDRLLTGAGTGEAAREYSGEVAREYGRFARRVRRSRVLRWMLGGVGVIDGDVPERLRGDVLRRTYRWIEEAGAAIDRWGEEDEGAIDRSVEEVRGALDRVDDSGSMTPDDADLVLALLPRLLAGAELAEARLIVASLDPDLERMPAGTAVPGG